MILIILIIVIFISSVIYTCIKSSSGYYDYDESYTELPLGHHLDDGFMLNNYMNYLQDKNAEKYVPVHNKTKSHTKHYNRHSSRNNTSRTNNLKVIRGNKKES